MPDISWNQRKWNEEYDWSEEGDEWSSHWGSSAALFWCLIFPRIQRMLPAKSIIEIAPGQGRWTPFLLPFCETYTGIDLNPKCIDVCVKKFNGIKKANFLVNDGRSFPQVPDQSIDFVFSFDSLVHVDRSTLFDYLKEMARVLKQSGKAFIHHSNLGAYKGWLKWNSASKKMLPYRMGKWLRQNVLVNDAWRAPDVTADWFGTACIESGITCYKQEKVNWENRKKLIDCFSSISKKEEKFTRIWDNPELMNEARVIKKLAINNPDLSPLKWE